MTALPRRRFLAITAAAVAGGLQARAATPLHRWRGVAMGAAASITLAHPEPERVVALARAEISRLEAIFSLYRADSALSRLNAAGRLDAPPFDLLACLSLAAAVHRATDGRFDPSVQPLWALYAERHAQGTAPTERELAATLHRVGWAQVHYTPAAIGFARPGMALTLNGIAQGYVADRVAERLVAEGLTDVLVDTGELYALGGHPDGGPWTAHLDGTGAARPAPVRLRDLALATSGPLGTAFDRAGVVGHVLDPATGRPAAAGWRLISVTAPSAGLADALSTACCLLPRPGIEAALASFPEARLAFLA